MPGDWKHRAVEDGGCEWQRLKGERERERLLGEREREAV